MIILKDLLLGLIQGLTEFLPVSSSGHLALAKAFLGIRESGVGLEVMLHLGTLLAILIYYRKRLWELVVVGTFPPQRLWRTPQGRLILWIVLGSIPAGIIGILLNNTIEGVFGAPHLVSIFLIITGGMLLLTLFQRKKTPQGSVGPLRAFLIGIAQSIAILPGISRSGSTIVTGELLGVEPRRAAEFSFFLAIPAIGGAVLLELTKGQLALDIGAVLGMFVSLVSGYFALSFLIRLIERGKLYIFAPYCIALGIVGLIFTV